MPTKTKLKVKTEPVLNKPKSDIPWYLRYVKKIDYQQWWEEFFYGINKNGTVKYKTIHSFIKAKVKEQTKTQPKKYNRRYAVLWWHLGPKVEIGHNEQSRYPNLIQLDWDAKRSKGLFSSSENLDKLVREVSQHKSSLESIATIGKVNIEQVARLQQLQNQVDKEFQVLFLPELSPQENQSRIQLYMSLLAQIQQLSQTAQETYARTQAVDLRELGEFISMFGPAMQKPIFGQSSAVDAKTIDGKRSVANSFVDMIMNKAGTYQLESPDPEIDKMVIDEETLNKQKYRH